jgi:hypothetical protein
LSAGAIWEIRRSSSCEDLSCGKSRWLINRVLNAASHSRITTTLTSTFPLQQSYQPITITPAARLPNMHQHALRFIVDLCATESALPYSFRGCKLRTVYRICVFHIFEAAPPLHFPSSLALTREYVGPSWLLLDYFPKMVLKLLLFSQV